MNRAYTCHSGCVPSAVMGIVLHPVVAAVFWSFSQRECEGHTKLVGFNMPLCSSNLYSTPLTGPVSRFANSRVSASVYPNIYIYICISIAISRNVLTYITYIHVHRSRT